MSKFNPAEVINLFKKTNFDLYKQMNEITNDLGDDTGDYKYLSSAHAEGSVWAHTMMVVNNLLHSVKDISLELFLAGLLHDIGKCHTKNTKEAIDKEGNISVKPIFYNHHHYSSIQCLGVLEKMYGESVYHGMDVRRIVELTNLHMVFHINFGVFENGVFYVTPEESKRLNTIFADNLDLYEDLLNLIKADSLGRITSTKEYEATLSKDRVLKKEWEHFFSYPKGKEEPKAVMFIGLPGTGKTVYRKAKYPSYSIVSQDDLVEAKAETLGLPYSGMFHEKRKKDMKEIANQNRANLCKYVREGKNFVIDMTNLSIKSRREKLNYISGRYFKEAVVFMRSLDKIFKTNVERDKIGRGVPVDTINRMAESFSVPTEEEFDKITYVFADF